MSQGKKKVNRKQKRLPLSTFNKLLYWVLFFLGLILIFSCIIFFVIWQQHLGKANNAIAVNSTASMLFLFIPLFPAIVAGLVFWEIGYQSRIPIISSRSKISIKQKKRSSKTKWVVVIAIVLWMVSFIPVIGAIYNRIEINETHIDTYAMFGRLTDHRPIEDATAVHAKIYYGSSGRYSYKWQMSYTIHFSDGTSFKFQKMPSILIEIDELFLGTPKTVEGSEHLDQLCDEFECTTNECERL